MVIEVATIDEDSEEELEDVETPNQSRQKRWQRVAQAAVKQCLRWGPFVSVSAKVSPPVCLENFKDMHKHACILRRAHTLVMRRPLHTNSLAELVAAAPLALVGLEGAPPVAQVLRDEAAAFRQASLPDAKPGLLLIGPEGDFTPEELEALIAAGAKPVGLGPNRLRVETAALAMLAAATLCDPGVSME